MAARSGRCLVGRIAAVHQAIDESASDNQQVTSALLIKYRSMLILALPEGHDSIVDNPADEAMQNNTRK